MTNNTPSAYFDRAKALQEMILNAQEDLKQLRVDALEELGVDDMPKQQAKEIRKDLAEVFAVAKIEVKGEIERRNQAAKMARRKRIAEECGVQLDLLDETPAAPARRMARAAVNSGKSTINQARATASLPPIPPHDPETGEVLDDDEDAQPATTSDEPTVMHAGGMNDRDWQSLGDIPDFLRR